MPSSKAKRPSLAERVRTHCAENPPAHFTTDAMVTMACAIEQIAADRDPLELALFMDWATGRLVGRVGQEPGMPKERDLFPLGLAGIDEVSLARHGRPFHAITAARRKSIVDAVEDGCVQGGIWLTIPPRYFYRRFYTKVVHGMFAEKKEWLRIGILRTADPGETVPRAKAGQQSSTRETDSGPEARRHNANAADRTGA